jgi:DNA-binding ferritin-like protein
MSIAQLLAIMFLSRDMAHRAHWKTSSYAQHVALATFYDEIVDRADAIAEAYQGRYLVIDHVPILNAEGEKSDIADALESHMEDIEKLRYIACDKEDSPLQNLIDSAIELYLSTLYKLRNLK